MDNEPPAEEEVEFMSIPVEVAVDANVMAAIGDLSVVEPGESATSLQITQRGKAIVTCEREEVTEAMDVQMEDVNDDEADPTAEGDGADREIDDYMYLEDLNGVDVQNLAFTGLDDLKNDADFLAQLNLVDPGIHGAIVSHVASEVCADIVPSTSEASSSRSAINSLGPSSTNTASSTIPTVSKLGPGFRDAPDLDLVKAGQGDEKMKSQKNDRWAVRRADQLRAQLGWDMSVDLGDLAFGDLDTLLSDLFTRVVKVNGKEYPSESLMNMLGGFNRVIRRRSEIRAVNGRGEALTKEFNIKYHASFPRTRMVLRAAMKKSAKNGNNKKRIKVGTVTLEMEMAMKLDLDHQITSNVGCQKRLALYLMLRLGIRGGLELWNLRRGDIKLLTDANGREYISFEERVSKNNSTDLDRTKEEQFRQTYCTYEEDFILTFKQYIRHMAPMAEGVKPDLFMQPISGPAGLIWYNKVTKVAERVCGQWLKNMMVLVGLPPELITSNKAGRVTLITRMAACGVPDEIGCMVTGHHTTDGYGRYDRTKDLKMEAAVLAGCTPGLSYQSALSEVSKKFVEEKIVGSSAGLHPLMDIATLEKEDELRRDMRLQLESSLGHVVAPETSNGAEAKNKGKRQLEATSIQGRQVVRLIEPLALQILPVLQQRLTAQNGDYDQIDWERELVTNPTLARALARVSDNRFSRQIAASHQDYDGINWDEEVKRNPTLARHLGTHSSPVQAFTGNTFSNLSNCTIQICVGPSRDNTDENKENTPQ